jgi:hypothetical protein
VNRGPVVTHDCRISTTRNGEDIPLCWVCFDMQIRTRCEGLFRANP